VTWPFSWHASVVTTSVAPIGLYNNMIFTEKLHRSTVGAPHLVALCWMYYVTIKHESNQVPLNTVLYRRTVYTRTSKQLTNTDKTTLCVLPRVFLRRCISYTSCVFFGCCKFACSWISTQVNDQKYSFHCVRQLDMRQFAVVYYRMEMRIPTHFFKGLKDAHQSAALDWE